MLGNAWEWVQDCYTEDYVGAPVDGGAWEAGGCAGRVMRGASWASTPTYLRAAHRAGEHPEFRSDYTGFPGGEVAGTHPPLMATGWDLEWLRPNRTVGAGDRMP